MYDFSNLAKVVLARTYSRPVGNRIETWAEIVDRVVGGNVKGHNVPQQEIERLKYFMLNRKASPAGRGLWISGTKNQEKLGGSSLVNCWGFICDDWNNYVIAADLLMLGGGVGLSVESKYVDQLPRVKKDVVITHRLTKDTDYIVPDTREGWCRLLFKVLEAWMVTGKGFSYSTICIRSAGEPISGFGGVSSGPRPLVRMVEDLCSLFLTRQGKKLRPIDAADIMCCIAAMVVSGNVRRSAVLIQGDAWDRDFLKAKRWDLGPIPTYRAMANYSIVASDVEHDLRPLFWETYKQGEAFGIINIPNIRKYGRMGEEKRDNASVVNPCFSEDTMIAVADGRGKVSIKQLAEEGRDVPVYSIDPITGIVSIKWGRNPRVTGFDKKMLRVTLDSGKCLVVTPEHEIPLKNGVTVQAKDLSCGDSLHRFVKTQERPAKGSNLYWRVTTDTKLRSKKFYEHRLVCQFFKPDEWERKYSEGKNNGWHQGGLVIHHKDYNSLNNSIDNLEVMTFREHNAFHAKNDRSGPNNGRFSGHSNKDIEVFAVELTKELGRKFSTKEWAKFCEDKKIPCKFTNYRTHEGWFKTPSELAIWAAIECGHEEIAHLDPRTARLFQTALQQGYSAFVEGERVLVNKTCEVCTSDFSVGWGRREQSVCSISCSNTLPCKNRKDGLILSAKNKQEQTRHEQIMVYKDLELCLGREPFKKEFEGACRSKGAPFRFSSTTDAYKDNPFVFEGFKQLKAVAKEYNHRVVSVEEYPGEHTVYNITVDDNHTVAVVLSESDLKMDGVFVAQCGEATLENAESCNLQDINLTVIDSKEEFAEAARLMHRWGKRVAMEKYHWPQVQAVVDRNHRIGTGITGCLQRLDLFNPDILDYVYGQIQEENVNYSKELNIEPSIRTTVIKPSGSLSKVFDSSCEGIHPAYSKHFIQRIRIASNDPLVSKLKVAGHHIEPQQRLDGSLDPDTMVVDFYVKTPEGVPCADDGFDTWKQLDAVKMAQKHWADQSISVTAYYKDGDLPAIKDWLTNNLSEIKTISFLRHSGHGFVQAPKETITEEQYEKLSSKVRPVEFDNLEEAGTIEGLECAGGSCPIR